MTDERLAYLRQQAACMPVVARATVWCWMQEALDVIDDLRALVEHQRRDCARLREEAKRLRELVPADGAAAILRDWDAAEDEQPA